MKKKIFLLSIIGLLTFKTYSQFFQCLKETQALKVGSLMPYTKVKVGDAEGYFLIDFGTTSSTIDTNAFTGNRPKLVTNTTNRFDNFDFFGSWGTVSLAIQNHSNILGLGNIKQAGIIGTDFLCFNSYLLDYQNSKLLRGNSSTSCPDSILKANGFKAATTAGYFSNDLKKLNNPCTPNIPTIPIKIGNAAAVAQIDPGYDDKIYRHAININQAYFKAIRESGIFLIENPSSNFTLSTCVTGIQEKVKAYKLPTKTSFSITGLDGSPIIIHSDVNIFLKMTPSEAKECGGIGTWTIPAAQLGASFLIDAKKVYFDPFAEKVWFNIIR
ncbi:hypothetical protein [Flectobacillus roseus]|uniref:Aspartyl protease n=1 Tax=Flectobacillus roseus TaxID=502259 RepID=A0ABT6Y315_9BACT|nr:hypothetical protein [Flectobacillus roseus]MDI9857960.1 hypothetical protein [Flectobacillus roseus]